MEIETAINLLQDLDNFIIVISNIEPKVARDRLVSELNEILNRQPRGIERAEEVELWKYHRRKTLKVKILKHL